ncbi:LysR family transcriptional regulator [Rhodoferax koreense]|uniref:LysR family transcriptional regulator n=1 Tax=Rhodoferax koreensis TaxID=1842727 RepID=A0A1P8JZK3_9BURK|nr:LysR family transcriptional regulator [Rhodoferax koreense]APW39194.1 LysR family transcriptional regulator [Rhodoferax koreense]
MDRLQAMNAFVTVVDCGGFASAARRLGMSPPVVTRAVAELEERLGLRLLTRTTRFVRVTEAGARFAEDCRRILGEIDEAEVAASGTHAAARGTLVLTAPVLFGQLYVMPLLVDYLQRCPEVDAQCLFVDRIVNLDEEGVDVAIRIAELPNSSMQATRVGRVRGVLVASPAYLRTRGTPAHPRDLEQHTLVARGGNSPTIDWQFVEDGKITTRHLRARMRTNSNDSAIAAAVAGFGIAQLLSYQVDEHLRQGRLQAVLAPFEMAALPIHVVHREGRRATQKVRGFIDLAVETLRAHPALR